MSKPKMFRPGRHAQDVYLVEFHEHGVDAPAGIRMNELDDLKCDERSQ